MVDASAKKPEKSEQKPNQIVDPVALFLGLPLMKTVNSHSLYVKSRDKVCAMLPSSVEFAHSMKKHMIPFTLDQETRGGISEARSQC